jgi:hypothetical protein
MRFGIDQPPCARNRRVVRRRIFQTHAQEIELTNGALQSATEDERPFVNAHRPLILPVVYRQAFGREMGTLARDATP